jgi:hypothetical protein
MQRSGLRQLPDSAVGYQVIDFFTGETGVNQNLASMFPQFRRRTPRTNVGLSESHRSCNGSIRTDLIAIELRKRA